MVIIPTTRDKLISGVAEGLGDIAGGNITVTESRQAIVDFLTPPDLKGVNEIVVTGPKAPAIASVDDLSGKTVTSAPPRATMRAWSSSTSASRRRASRR